MIEVKNLTKRYGNHLAVDHLNFTVESGKIYGFLGPNGAGKSTILKSIIGQLKLIKRGSVAGWNHYGSHEGKRHKLFVCL